MDMQRSILTCLECHQVCTETIAYCLDHDRRAESHHIGLLIDCADICGTTANFMMRRSDLHASLCAVCADVCERCAESCDGLKDDEQMNVCAAICRQCAQSCREMTRIAA